MIEFTTKELITLAIAVISICFNIIQWQRKKTIYKPIYNALVGLFNAIKIKRIYYYARQKALENPNNPYNDVSTVKHDFSIFIQEIIIDFEGIKEHLVAALKTMDESDRAIFKAADFGLTDEEKRQREEFFRRGGDFQQS